MLFLYFIQVFAYRTRAGVFLQRYFYFLVFSCVASDFLYNPVMGFFSQQGLSWEGWFGRIPIASVRDAQCRSFVSACFGQRCRCFAGGEIACEKVFLCYGLQVFI